MKLLTMGTFLLIATHAGDATSAEQPKPSAEVQKLGYYLGTWRGTGQTMAGPFGAAGKLSSTTTCEWFAGGYQLVCRGEERGPTGKRTFLNIRSYDETAKAYTEYGISSFGESEYNTGGTIVGNKRTFVVNTELESKATKITYTEVQLSSTTYTYRAEASVDGGPASVIAEGTVTKVN
jgi:hypothetical protein